MKSTSLLCGRLSFLFLMICSTFLVSCSKEIEADPIALAKASLIGNAINPTIWRLVEVKENGAISTSRPINDRTANYLIRFYQSGSFLDSEGVVGKWDMLDPQSLATVTTNLASGVELKQTYAIEITNNISLKMKYTYQGKTIELAYVTTAK